MELFSTAWWTALASIILIDLILAGDNALVIGMAAGKLPAAQRKRAILWGSFGALAVRVLLALAVVWLLRIPGLQLMGGLLLLPIAYRLAVPKAQADGQHHAAASTFWGAMRTIIVADALMGVDNVLAIGGAAHGRWDLVIIGLAVTVPLIVFGSTWVVRAIERWPVITPIGAAVLAITSAGMVTNDPLFQTYLTSDATVRWAIKLVTAGVIFVLGMQALKRASAAAAKA